MIRTESIWRYSVSLLPPLICRRAERLATSATCLSATTQEQQPFLRPNTRLLRAFSCRLIRSRLHTPLATLPDLEIMPLPAGRPDIRWKRILAAASCCSKGEHHDAGASAF